MPRINFEESVWSDVRSHLLICRLQTKHPELQPTLVRQLAAGVLVVAWQVAQKYWIDKDNPRSSIPDSIWELNGLCDELISVGFAERTESGVRMAGSAEAFRWLEAKSENGTKGGRPSKKSNDLESCSFPSLSEQKLRKPSSSSSSSSSSSLDLTNKKDLTRGVAENSSTTAVAVSSPRKRKPKESKEPKEKSPGAEVWDAYFASMKENWNQEPPANAKVRSQAAKLVELVGREKAIALAAYFPTRRKDFYVRSGHPFGCLLTDYPSLDRELSAGIKLTNDVVKDIVRKESSENFKKVQQTFPENDPLWLSDEQLFGNKTLLGEGKNGTDEL